MTIYIIKHTAKFNYNNYFCSNETAKYFEDYIFRVIQRCLS